MSKTTRTRNRSPDQPSFLIEGCEDMVYHELRLGERGNQPEFCAVLDKHWVFNRAMRWVEGPLGTLLCYSAAADLALTGEGCVSRWFSDPANAIEHRGAVMQFGKRSSRRRDAAVLPAFQFQLDQHAEIAVEVKSADAEWQFCALVKGRSCGPLLSSGWQTGPQSLRFDLQRAWRERGYNLHYPELHLAIGVWTPDGRPAELDCELRLIGRPAVVPCLPAIRTVASVREAGGVPVAAAALDENGRPVNPATVSVRACVGDRTVDLSESSGIWSALVDGLDAGDHEVELTVEGAVQAHSDLSVRVTDGEFYSYDSDARSPRRRGHPTGPLTGSYAGIVYFRRAGEAGRERIAQGQAAWDKWDIPPEERRYHYWEALTEKELDERFSYLARCGWNLLHLCQHWGIWERLDAGGRISPHGAEQLALFYRTAGRHGMAVLQALSHYPYGGDRTPVWQSYLDAGFQAGDWQNPDTPFTQRFHAYLKDYVALFREETALFAMTASGEGDWQAGRERVNATCRFVTSLDPNHLFIGEPLHRMTRLPHVYHEGWTPRPFCGRLYWIGYDLEPEYDLGVEYKILQLGDYVVSEASWPCPPIYARFVGIPHPWAGTRDYRIRWRDTLYLGLVHRSGMMLSWDEQCTEDEHLVLNEVCRLVNWSQPFRPAPICLLIDDGAAGGEDASHSNRERRNLAEYEQFFAHRALTSRYARADQPPPADVACVIDARKPYREPDLAALTEQIPLRLPAGSAYAASWLWSEDRKTLVAYLYNCGEHAWIKYGHRGGEAGGCLAGNIHRRPVPLPLVLGLRNLPEEELTYRLYDLDTKKLVLQGRVSESLELDLGKTQSDFVLLVVP